MPSSSLFLRSSATLVAALSLVSAPLSVSASPTPKVTQAYQIDTFYNGSSFFTGMDFYTDADPSNGFVTYKGQFDSANAGLVSQNPDGSWYIGVDSTTKLAWKNVQYAGVNGVGRQSVRFQSEKTWQYGLFIADIAHMPGGLCGTWPAFWTIGDGTWPYTGEIDILESSNALQQTLSSLHTGNTCSINPTTSMESGTLQHTDCDYNSGGTGANPVGCGVTGSTATYGSGFNAQSVRGSGETGGGIYAMEWKAGYISMWFFPRNSIPSDLYTDSPDPTQWGIPYANMTGNCDFSETNFQNHRIVVDNTFCGDLGDATWSSSGCSSKASTCAQFVAENPSSFTDAYWTFNAIKVYQLQNVAVPTTTCSTSSSTSSTSYSYPTSFSISTQPGVSFPAPASSTSSPYTAPSSTSTPFAHSFPSLSTSYAVPTSFSISTQPGVSFPSLFSSSSYSHPTLSSSFSFPTTSSYPTTTFSTGSTWTSSSTSTGSSSSTTGWTDGSVFGFPKGCPIGAMPTQWYSAIHSTVPATYTGDWSTSYSSADTTWADWTSTTATSKPADPTWADWTSTTTTTDPGDSTWADWTSSSTTTSADPTWYDWTSSSTTTSADPAWSDWTYSTRSADPGWADPTTASWTWAATSSASSTAATTATWSGQSSWVAKSTSPYSPVWTGSAASFSVSRIAGAVVAFIGVVIVMV